MKTGCYCYAVKQCQRSWNPLVRYVRIHVNNAKLFLSSLKMFECSLNADWGAKKGSKLCTQMAKQEKWHYHLDTFCWKLHLFKKQKNLCFLHFFWSVNNSLSLQQAFVYIFKKQKEIEIHKTCNGYLLDKNLPHCAKQFLSLKLIYLL